MAGSDAERKRLVGAARRALTREGEGERLAALAGDLFARVALEDLATYSAEELAGLVRAAGALLAERKPGRHLVRIAGLAPDSGGRDAFSLVEILNDNMPFLVDSVLGELQDFGVGVRLVAHPIVTVERDGAGRLKHYRAAAARQPAIRESLILAHLDRPLADAEREELEGRLDAVLGEIRNAVADWPAMIARARRAVETYRKRPPPIPPEETAEAIAFLEWLVDDNFTFLGVREYDFRGGAAAGELRRAEKPGLGILSDPGVQVLRRGADRFTTTPAIREFLMRPEPLIVTKANAQARVHRRAYMDYVGVKQYRPDGTLAGELRLIGLFTSTAYTRRAGSIPYLRRKIAAVLARAGYDPAGHSGKALANVLESYPRDELFQIDEGTLFEFATLILALGERPRVRVLARRDKFDRFVSVLVFVPRDRYDSVVRVRIGEYLAGVFAGHVSAFYPAFPEGALARVHFIVGRDAGHANPDPDRASLESAVAAIVRSWADGFGEALRARLDPARAGTLATRYGEAFSPAYRDHYQPETALADTGIFERLTPERPVAGEFHPAEGAAIGLKLVHLGPPIALSTLVPRLEDMGFGVIDERTYAVRPNDGHGPFHVHDMTLEAAHGGTVDLDRRGALLLACFMAVWHGEAESDGYNALVVNAGLAWRDIAWLRAVSRYLRQAGAPYSQHYMAATLCNHPGIAEALCALFHARFDPGRPDPHAATAAAARIETALEGVQSLDEDRIVRSFVNLVEATVRTNFFQPVDGGGAPAEISFKLDSRKVEGLPAPKPFREIFVYGPRVEGVHLRFGRIARGGIRWSDRPQDFRTEVLGLAKAQQVKNAVIVPGGSKGGFVPKHLPAGGSRDAVMAEGIAAYKIFISRLLDLTDNLDGGTVTPPPGVVRLEGDDPYLVVAADKGTATFSDIANGIAIGRGFWLGDAFASGGSAGYDHKQMAITARGAWEAVKRHFREMNLDIQTTPFSAVGVGDMSGDVFGNAMLLSPAMKLVAAFDHRDIFIDPDPDQAASLAERRRLFELPRSSWQDYDREKLSAGGGVFSRHDKAAKLPREARALLGLHGERATPHDVIQAILTAKVDLLFFGGIGTFVRAPGESDDRVGDRANDGVRVNADALRARVVGEGANLGMTQRARIAFGLAGGRCNSDAIDNSAGVNTSDVEVNIKIALGSAVRAGRLDEKRRNRLLASMTGDVAALVLRNNYLQTLAISLAERRGFEDFGFQRRLMQELEGRGLLDRAVETLPDDAALAERRKAGKPLTRTEIGVLLAYAKIALSDDLVGSDVVDDPALAAELVRYFPAPMRKDHAAEIAGHRLRREIIATVVANSMINRGGPTYLVRVGDRTGATVGEIARAYVAMRDAFRLRDLNAAIDRLDGAVAGAVQLDLYRVAADLVLDGTVWFLRNASFADGIGAVVAAYGKAVAALGKTLAEAPPAHLKAEIAARASRYAAAGVPEALARRVAGLPALAGAPDIHLVAGAARTTLARAAGVFFAVAERFRIARIEALVGGLPVADHYDGLALDRALATLRAAHRRIAIEAIAATKGGDPVGAWIEARRDKVERAMTAVAAITEGEELSVSRATVAATLLAELAGGGAGEG